MPDNTASDEEASNIIVLSEKSTTPSPIRLPRFIAENIDVIVGEWEAFARTLTPFAVGMTSLALRDHIHQILAFIVPDIQAAQTPDEQRVKSHGVKDGTNTAAQTHAAIRFSGGFDIGQMVSEYRALRASILKLWGKTSPTFDEKDIDDMTRFNESIDQELAESVNFYTGKVARSKDLVVGILGHDLRGPIQAIRLSAELVLHMGQINERQTMLIRNVLESSIRMGELISNLLDVTRARFGSGLPVVRSMMNMGAVAQQVIDEVRVINPSRAIEVTLSGNLAGEWDRARIGQVFSNLVGNAVQYGFHGSPIRINVAGSPDAVMLTINSEGVPIPADRIGLIFDPLTRGLPDGDGTPPSGSLGLGLYITKEVVVAHGGTIEVTSSDLDGTVFTALFPRLIPEPTVQNTKQLA